MSFVGIQGESPWVGEGNSTLGATVAGSSSGTSGDDLSELCMPTGAKDRREGGVWRGGWFGWLVGKSPEIWERIKPSWGHQITGSDGLDGVFFY